MAVMESAASSPPTIRRDPERRLIAGVCAGMARYFGIDPLWVRVAFVAASAAGGFGIVVYLLGWAFMPVDASVTPARRPWTGRRASLQVGAGAGLLLLALLLALRATGIWFSDAIVWPLVLVGAGTGLLWRQSLSDATEPTPLPPATRHLPARRPARRAACSSGWVGCAVAPAAVFLSLPPPPAPPAPGANCVARRAGGGGGT